MKLLHASLWAAVLLSAGCSREAPPADTAPAVVDYAALARGRVEVEGGLLKLASPREGVVREVRVHEGDRVAKGQVLAMLDAAAATLQADAARAELAAAQAQRQLVAGKLAAARVQAGRLAEAAQAGAGDGQSADAAAAAADALTAELSAADAAIRIAANKGDAARHEIELHSLRASIDAQVVRVATQPGASVGPATGALFVLLPATAPIVRAEISEAYVDAVSVGMPATVSADGGHAQDWPAHVLHVGRVVGPSALEDDPQQRANLRTVACVLAFDRVPPEVRVGQRVLVRFGKETPKATKDR